MTSWFLQVKPWLLFGLVFGLPLLLGLGYTLVLFAAHSSPAELQQPVGKFFLLWFFLVGAWQVQPRLNALAAHSIS